MSAKKSRTPLAFDVNNNMSIKGEVRENISKFDTFIKKKVIDDEGKEVSNYHRTTTTPFNMNYNSWQNRGKGEGSGNNYEIALSNTLSYGKKNLVDPLDEHASYAEPTSFSNVTLDTLVDKLNETLNLYTKANASVPGFGYNNRIVNKYNRFKVPQPEIEMQNAYAHVFFTRPECNIMANSSKLQDQFSNDLLFNLAFKSDPNMVKELSALYGPAGATSHKFLLTLSNMAKGFGLNDEEIQSDNYGRTYTGYKISYGKNNVESKTAGNFQVTYGDDRDLHVYRLHKLWVEYISGVYRGRYHPESEYILNKTMDYTCGVYYIMTDEEGERILFWSKYYGVYPTTIPSSQYSWEADNPLRPNTLTVSYNYSFKQDYDPYILQEFNVNAGVVDSDGKPVTSGVDTNGNSVEKEFLYEALYDPELLHVGKSWVGAPFIEKVNSIGNKYEYYLRFRKV